MKPISLLYDSPCGNYQLCFDFDGKTAYAYLLKNRRIQADVWLYNAAEAPEEPEWKQPSARDRLPFSNSREYVKKTGFVPPGAQEQLNVNWEMEDGAVRKVLLFIDGALHATLAPDEKIGHCRLVCKNGPLAQILES